MHDLLEALLAYFSLSLRQLYRLQKLETDLPKRIGYSLIQSSGTRSQKSKRNAPLHCLWSRQEARGGSGVLPNMIASCKV